MLKSRAVDIRHCLRFLVGVLELCAVAVLACIISVSALAFAARPDVPVVIERAERDYAARADVNNVRHAIALLREVVTRNPKSYEALWRIAKYDCYLARQLPDKQQNAVLENGVKAGKEAERLDARRPEAHFWTGANEGLLAENGGLFAGLRLIDPIRKEMETVKRLDSDYEQDGAERILGRLYYEAPFFRGGNKQLSVRILEKCLRRFPKNSLTMLYLADSYRATGHRDHARKMLRRILDLGPSPQYAPELAQNQDQARRELRKYFHTDQ
ncbi:MAG: tetratricopeptide repeat protein [Terriglobia bacterium]